MHTELYPWLTINAFESGIVVGGGAVALPLEVVGGGGIVRGSSRITLGV
jgi:hypothetical protein